MITEQDLQEAIAECQGVRNPNAQTCIKLAAYYTILDHLTKTATPEPEAAVLKRSQPPAGYSYSGSTEFAEAVHGKNTENIMPVIDELMSALSVLNPKLYRATIQKLSDL